MAGTRQTGLARFSPWVRFGMFLRWSALPSEAHAKDQIGRPQPNISLIASNPENFVVLDSYTAHVVPHCAKETTLSISVHQKGSPERELSNWQFVRRLHQVWHLNI